MTTQPTELHVYQWGPDWWIGSSVADVLAQIVEHYGDPDFVADEDEPELLRDDHPLRIVCDEHGEISDEGESVTKTCAEWIAKEGRGMLASSEY